MIRIGIEDLVANALIELNEHHGIGKVTGEQINAYEKAVLEYLKQKGINAICLCDRYMFAQFKDEYSDFFTVHEDKNSVEYFISESIDVGALYAKFRGYLSIDLLLAFVNENVVNSLSESLTYEKTTKSLILKN